MTNLNVTYITHSGNDLSPVNAARISRDAADLKKTKPDEKDVKLMNFLAENKHMTPFEHATLTVLVECPLFIRSQIQRHRTFSYNEVSRRYTSDNIDFYIPDKIYIQGTKDKQKSGEVIDESLEQKIKDRMIDINDFLKISYDSLIGLGVSREYARMVLPNSLMTKFYMTGNIRNWAHFLELRLSDHAQYESQVIAQEILKVAKKYFPLTMKTLMEHSDIDSMKVNDILSGDY